MVISCSIRVREGLALIQRMQQSIKEQTLDNLPVKEGLALIQRMQQTIALFSIEKDIGSKKDLR